MPGKHHLTDYTVPAENAEAVTPSDTVNFTNISRGIYVGVGGDIAVVMASGDTATLVNVVAGSLLPLSLIRVNSTGTTATNIISVF